jgi:hypothetical protein
MVTKTVFFAALFFVLLVAGAMLWSTGLGAAAVTKVAHAHVAHMRGCRATSTWLVCWNLP